MAVCGPFIRFKNSYYFLSEEPQPVVLPMQTIRQQSNKVFSQQKLHNNVNKDPKMYLLFLEAV
jgi:glutathione synthase/RimK-type ligase-like ATP-grasp enzyme